MIAGDKISRRYLWQTAHQKPPTFWVIVKGIYQISSKHNKVGSKGFDGAEKGSLVGAKCFALQIREMDDADVISVAFFSK